jgi:hypothetical protein
MINRNLQFRHLLVATILASLLFAAGCVQSPPPSTQEQQQACDGKDKTTSIPDTGLESEQNDFCPQAPDEQKIRDSEQGRAHCYSLHPGAVTHTKKGRRTVGRCQPQSLIYARCRTGFMSCRLGDTSPVQWFHCARKNKITTSRPTAGSVMVLDSNSRRGMPTGHPVYVEDVKANGDGTWLLRISHTNYDRKCHLDLDATVLYNPAHMTASFRSGPWSTWASDLKVLGFILH